MNKKHIGWLLALPMLMGFGLTSCSSEMPISEVQNIPTKEIDATLIANLGSSTRALTFDEQKKLKFKWEIEDLIYVVNGDDGNFVGVLYVGEVKEDPTQCIFKGKLNLPTEGTTNLKFYFLGEKGEMSFENGKPLDLMVDFSNQTGTADELDDFDILKATKAYKGSDNGNLGVLDFNRYFSQGQFVLEYNKQKLDLTNKTVVISANTGKFYNKATLNFQTGEFTPITDGPIKVSNVTENFYINLIPTEAVNMMFTVAMDEGTFIGYKGKEIIRDTYYSDQREAIVVEMENSSLITYKVTFEDVDGNPLDGIDPIVKPSTNATETISPLPAAPEKTDYEFVGWVDKNETEGTPKRDAWELTSGTPEVILIPIYAEKEYNWTVTWKDGYTDDALKTMPYSGKDGTVNIINDYPADPPRKGFTFTGWAPQVEVLTKGDLNVEIVAQWEEVKKPTVTTPGYGHGEFE